MNKSERNLEALREAILQQRLQKRIKTLEGQADAGRIGKADRSQALPLSFAQQRLWFIDRLESAGGAAYHMPAALRLTGTLDRTALRAALDRLVARHENLRTTFPEHEGEPRQHIAPADCGFALAERDLTHLHGSEQALLVSALCTEEAGETFDLAAGPLIRGQLLQLGETEYLLLITKHHIISDGWSIGVMVRELSALYAAFAAGLPDPLPPLAIQYADYALWQRQWLQGEVLGKQTAFWKAYLAGAPELLELPTDRPRPMLRSYAGAAHAFTFPAELSAGIRALGQRHGTTLFMTLLAGWSLLLARLSGQRDVVVGTPVANRQRSEIESLIGFFVNSLALRVQLDEALDVAGLLAAVRANTLAAFEHQDLPFEQVVEALSPVRSMSYSPLFQVALSLEQDPETRELQLPGLVVQQEEQTLHAAQFDISLILIEHGDELRATLRYATDLFDETSMRRLADGLLSLLTGMVANDGALVDSLPLMDAAARSQVLVDFNATTASYPQHSLIHTQFEARAAQTPEAIAAVFGDTALSYAELNARANRLAHALLAHGVDPDDRVVLCAERGVEMLVGILAVLKAGGCYVPLDPSYPDERIAFMLADAAPKAVLTLVSLRHRLPVQEEPLLLDDAPAFAAQPDHNPQVAGLSSRNLAYIIYTSGSTGQPKGVMVEHRNVLRLVLNNPYARIGADDCVAHCANIAFDASTWEIWSALLNGGRVLLVPPDVVLDPQRFGAALTAGKATAIFLTTALFNQYADSLAPVLSNMRHVLFGGEQADIGPAARLQQVGGPARLVHVYGPTETTTFATAYHIAGIAPEAVTLPIGRPIANTTVYILDAQGQPVPVGVAGEIHIGGHGVARGYLNRAELTAERFLTDPFSTEPDARMYRTGDLGRWLPDGSVDYLGRNDFQVKIRGFRIELGEIESRLAGLDGLRDVAVLAREDQPGEKRLVAYYTLLDPLDADALDAEALRTHLARQLPDYMVPAAYMRLDKLPLTPNGKLDRRALPAPDSEALSSSAYEAPRGTVEEALAQVWQGILGIDRVGRHDHFFRLGGHSLLAVQLITRLREVLGVELALQDLFAHPVLADLAALLGASVLGSHIAIVPADRSQPLPLSFAQQQLWFIDQLGQGNGAAYHVPAAVRLYGRLDHAALHGALDRIVARHEVLRTTFVQEHGEVRQHIAAADCGFQLVERDLTHLHGQDQALLAWAISTDEAGEAFDLAAGPLIRGRLLKLADEEHLLLVTQHHIISDGWSVGVLVRELSELYAAFAQRLPDPLPSLPIQYADYALWQRQALQGDTLTGHADFWRSYLAGAPALLEMPSDRPRQAVQSHAGALLPARLPASLVANLKVLSRRHGVTLFMTLLAGWGVLLSRLSGQQDVVVGAPLANRQRRELEPLIGDFVNTVPVRLRPEARLSVATLLTHVKESALSAFAHQEMPLDQLVSAVQPARSLAYSPLFQASLTFNDQAFTGRSLHLPGLTLDWQEQPHTSSQFDFSLILAETGGEITGNLTYATDLFDASSMVRLLTQYEAVLTGMARDDSQTLADLSLLSSSERSQVLFDFNATAADYPQHSLIHTQFEARAAQTPEAVAAVFGDTALSYAELNARANRLAHQLISLGVRPDDRVALCLERNLDLLVALLGILKAGGCYVPLDPNYPTQRIAYMLDDCKPVVLLTQASLQDELPASSLMHTLLLDDDEFGDLSALARQPDHNPQVAGLSSRNLAYIIYTSGSTGQPKGVMVEHRNVLRLVLNNPYARIGADDCVAHCANIAFDASTWEIWSALLNGGRVLLVPQDVVLQPEAFSRTLVEGGVTAMWLTVGLFNEYVDLLAEAFGRLRYLLVGGDALDPRSIARLLARAPAPQQVVNGYGPTETTTFAITHAITAPVDEARAIPIGRPIANTTVYILDPQGQPVPVGVAGEIHIGGHGVARGYLNRAELTAERFLTDPFSAEPDARMYRTGDLGRWLPDGSVDYLGRNDFQVKIRGFRIELGEIESRLAGLDGLRDVAVLAREDQPGEKRLVAYYTLLDPLDADALDAEALRTHLARQLPDYMVPAAYCRLDAFPLTPNGKLNRRELPPPNDQSFVTGDYVAPGNDTEATFCRIWCEVLGLDRVGIHDNFFDVGGDSIRSIAIITHAKTAGFDLTIVDLFAHPTIYSLSLLAGERRLTERSTDAVSLLKEADRQALPEYVEDAYPLTRLQLGMIFHNQLEASAGLYHDVFSHCIELPSWHESTLRMVLDAMSRKHPVLRTSFDLSSFSEPLQLVHRHARIPLEVFDLRTLGTAEQDSVIAEFFERERHAVIALDEAPLFRLFIHLRDEQTVQYTTSFHHAILDGWSVASLQTELFNNYFECLRSGNDALTLAQLSITPKLTVQREQQALACESRKTFWRDYLADNLPAALPQADGEPVHGKERFHTTRLPAEITTSLRNLASELSVPLRTVLLTAHLRMLATVFGQDDVTTGLVCNVRPEEAEGDKVLGLFLNTLPLRVKLARGDWKSLVRQVYESELAVLAHRDYPYFQLRQDNGQAAHYEAVFNFTNFHVYDELQGGLQNDRFALTHEATGFGLDVNFNFSPERGILVEVAPGSLSAIQGERIFGYLLNALETLADAAGRPHEQCSLLGEDEHRLLAHFNDSARDFPASVFSPQMIEAQAEQQPDAVALLFDGAAMSFGELNRRANQLAHRLLELGVRSDDRVAICATRGFELVIGLLGILKSGAGYLPLDPSYPAERLAYMLQDSAPVAMVVQSGLAALFADYPLRQLMLDDASLASRSATNPVLPEPVAAHHLAYVIYTSGSTGQPKGVMVEHGNMANVMHWHMSAEALTPQDRVLQFASHSFDVSVAEIFPSLAAGSAVVLRMQEMVGPDAAFVEYLERHGVTVCDVPTAFWHLWVAEIKHGRSHLPTTLRLLMTGGEKAECSSLKDWFANESMRACRLMNAYGPTEATVTATAIIYGAESELPDQVIPIGRPLFNYQIHVLDPLGQPAPIGVVGEIHIGGLGVARGYLGQPDLTAARFIPDPSKPGARLYKTGDLGRWLPSGLLEFVGRNDFQVKIRGFRIELGEIESRLAACVGVREAVVAAREDHGDKRLVAYVTPLAGEMVTAAALREQLAQTLAEHMLPSAFVILDELPKTSNGKLDRKALPAPAQADIISRPFEAPIGEVEQAVVEVWRSLLSLDRVSRHDHFFESGGHSLNLVLLVERLRQRGYALDAKAVYAAPTVAGMAQTILRGSAPTFCVPANPITADSTEIRPDMLPLVELTPAEIDTIVAQVSGGVANIQDIYPLSPLQEGILFHHLLAPEQDSYVLRNTLAFDGRARLDSFLQAMQQIVDRHDILRTAFHWKGLAKPVQVVQREAQMPIVEHDLHGVDNAERHFLDLTDPANIGFDLSCGPLLAAHIAPNGVDGGWLLALMSHHLIGDHGAVELMIGELQALLHGRADLLAPPAPYRNFIAQHLADDPLVHEAYFRRMLADVDEPSCAFGIVDAQIGAAEIADTMVDIAGEQALAIREAARRLSTTPAVLFHVATAIVLARCTGREDVVFGTVMSGRLQGSEATSQVMGMFMNTLPFRVPLTGETAAGAVRRTQAGLAELLAHEQAPLVLAKRCSGIDPSLPLFTTLLNFRHSHRDTSQDVLASVDETWQGIRILTSDERTNYPLTFHIDDLGEDFSVSVQCLRSIGVARLGTYFLAAVQGLVNLLQTTPDASLLDISVLPADERTFVLDTCNATSRPYPAGILVHQLFEAQVARVPSRIAAVHGSQAITYAALNARANQLAHLLGSLGVRAGARVAICIERSLDMLVAVLGVLKAGGAYVPLDPAYPADRLAHMLADSQPAAILTQASLQAGLPAAGVPVVALDACATLADQPQHDIDAAALGLDADGLAYVIYTSGSTGLPKGVMVEHRGVVNFLASMAQAPGMTEDDVQLALTTLSFDIAALELYLPLSLGARIVLADRLHQLDADALAGLIDAQGVTMVQATPTSWKLLMNSGWQGRPGIKALCGGEALPRELATRLAGFAEVWNLYGPTETTIWSATCRVLADEAIHLGSPIANTRIYLLDPRGEPVPVGVAGEIFIGGHGVARGYLNRAELSAERFAADPFCNEAGARMYRTGDLGRRLPDGSIEYLGRNDFQVKIRGFRIETGEIEARLAGVDGVQDVAVVPRDAGSGEKRLIAYYTVANGETEVGAETLRTFLAAQLPDYMVPAAYVRLDALPQTPNGKLDRRALPEPDMQAFAARGFEPPTNDTEAALCCIWAEVLGLAQVGVRDNFFDLGGDSIRSIGIVNKARAAGLDMAIVDLFSHPTVDALAAVLNARQGHTRATDTTPLLGKEDLGLLPDDVEAAYPVTLLQMGMFFHNQLDASAGLYHDVFSQCLELPGWNESALRMVLDQVAARHPVLRTAFDLAGYSEPLQLVQRHAVIPLAVHDLRELTADEQDTLITRFVEHERGQAFVLEQAPLLRVFIHLRNTNQVQCTLSLHHAIMDGWSVAAFLTELFDGYLACLAGGSPQPGPAAPRVTPEIAVREERAALASDTHRQFWRSYLAEHVFTALPEADREMGEAPHRNQSVFLEAALVDRLQHLASELSVPLRTVLLAAHMRVLSLISGQQDITTGLVSNVRPEDTDGEKVLGLFLNTLPLRLMVGQGSWKELIAATMASEIAVMAHRHYPYFQLHADNGRAAYFDTAFNYTHFHVYGQLGSGLKASGQGLAYEATGYGLGVNFARTARGLLLELSPDKLSASQTARILGYYQAVLDKLAHDPHAPCGDCQLLPTAEYGQVIEAFNQTQRAYPPPALLHSLFEAQAKARPDAPALAFAGRVLSYAELNRRANRLANHLIGLGIRADDRVALCVTRGFELVVGILGILKAGAAYVPLDPAYPAERLSYMLADSCPAAIVGSKAALPVISGTHLPVVALGEDALQSQPEHDPQLVGIGPQNLAYVVYTSGSTGRPKGVMVEHCGLCNLIRTQIEDYGVDTESRVLQFVSASFDVCISEIAMALCSGAVLHLASAEALLPGEPLVATLREQRISHVSMPTAVFATLPDDAELPDLRAAMVGGDVLPPALVQRWAGRLALFNCYGPTETTVCASHHRCLGTQDGAVPIGRPLANTRIYVLDHAMQPAPVGVIGEIYIAGAGVARGYLGQAELSAQRFPADPFHPGDRMYRTGDCGAWRPDGTLVFAGRNDFQVKIRGFRIELGEIEAQLAACDGVREALVLAREDLPGDKRLVGYVVAAEGVRLEVEALRRALTASLAEHMVPTALVVLDTFPLTPNGKVDRRALPAPTSCRGAVDYVPPCDELEGELCEAFAAVLGLDRVGIHDSLFELGGNSILVVKLHSRLALRYPGQIAVADFFQHTTVARLAEHLRKGDGGNARVDEGTQRAERRKNRLAAQKTSRNRQTVAEGDEQFDEQ